MNIQFKRTSADDRKFKLLVDGLNKELRDRYGEIQAQYDAFNIFKELNTVLIAVDNEKPIGCGCFKFLETEIVEIKRMYVQPDYRGNKISIQILRRLEEWALELGAKEARLETGSRLFEALSLYRENGYQIIDKYGPYVDMPESICLGKALNPHYAIENLLRSEIPAK